MNLTLFVNCCLHYEAQKKSTYSIVFGEVFVTEIQHWPPYSALSPLTQCHPLFQMFIHWIKCQILSILTTICEKSSLCQWWNFSHPFITFLKSVLKLKGKPVLNPLCNFLCSSPIDSHIHRLSSLWKIPLSFNQKCNNYHSILNIWNILSDGSMSPVWLNHRVWWAVRLVRKWFWTAQVNSACFGSLLFGPIALMVIPFRWCSAMHVSGGYFTMQVNTIESNCVLSWFSHMLVRFIIVTCTTVHWNI